MIRIFQHFLSRVAPHRIRGTHRDIPTRKDGTRRCRPGKLTVHHTAVCSSRASRTVVEIQHDLGRTPSDVVIYVAFSRTGASGTIASGDAGRIVGADDTRVVVENTTEQDFFVRVVLR